MNNKNETGVDLKTVELLHEFVKRRFITSLDTIDKLDQKLVTLISADAIIISILLSTRLFNDKLCFYISIGFILLSLVLGVCGYVPKGAYDEDPKETWEDYYSFKYNKAIKQLTSNLVDACNKNMHVAVIKGNLIEWGFYTLLAGIIFLLINKLI